MFDKIGSSKSRSQVSCSKSMSQSLHISLISGTEDFTLLQLNVHILSLSANYK